MAEALAGDVLTKAQFAEAIGRHPSFVSRAIAEGKIAGEAIVGTGRTARIRASEARRQLGLTLDFSQQVAQARPVLGLLEAGLAPAGDEDDLDGPLPAGLAAAKARNLELRNRKAALEVEEAERRAAVAAGELVPAADVARALARQLPPLVATFDELPPVISKALAEQFGLAYSEVLIAVKGAIRQSRAAWAERAREMARALEAA